MFNLTSACAFAIIFMISNCIAGEDTSKPPGPIIDGRQFDLNEIPITNVRHLRAPKEESKSLLSNKPFVELNPSQLLLLTGESDFSSEDMLKLEAENAGKYCAYLLLWINDVPDNKRLKDKLNAHKNYISYIKSIQHPLRPYLVKTQLYYPHTGNYSIYLRGDILDVFHSSLGSRTTELSDEYLIIFVEKSIKEVNVKADITS